MQANKGVIETVVNRTLKSKVEEIKDGTKKFPRVWEKILVCHTPDKE